MRTLVVLALALCCSGQITVPLVKVPFPWAIKYQGVDSYGQTTFGHQAVDQTRHEVRLADGRVLGQFSYIDANGKPVVTYFEAGPMGYRVLGSNNLPEAPEANFVSSVPEYSEEVALARAEFMEIFEEARKGNIILQDADFASGVPEYTEEVAKARAEFMEIFEEATKGNIIPPSPVPAPVEAVPEAEPALAAVIPEEVKEPATPEEPAEMEKAALSAPGEIVAKPAADEAAADAPAAEEGIETVRRRRDVPTIPLPYLHAVPTETKTTIETKQFEPVDAATPAATKKIELTTKEHVLTVPGFKFVQPVVEVKPLEYNLLRPQVLPYSQLYYPGFGHPLLPLVAAAPKEE